MPEEIRIDQEKREPRIPDWSQVGIVNIETGIKDVGVMETLNFHGSDIPREKVGGMITIMEAVLDGLDHTPEKRKKLKSVLDQLKVYQLIIGNDLPEVSLGKRLATVAETQTIREAHGYFDGDLSEKIRQPYTAVTSDSHATTGELLNSAQNSPDWRVPYESLAVLSFDHHTDLGHYNAAQGDRPAKANVMSYILRRDLAAGALIIGPKHPKIGLAEHANHLAYTVGLKEMSADNRVDKEAYFEQVRKILAILKAKGISRLYPSIDLDCLRLEEQLYTGVDYTSVTNLRGIIGSWEYYESEYDLVSKGYAREPHLFNIANFILANYTAYQGLPASLIIQTLELARREFGFDLGLRNARTGQVIAGDIVEYNQLDYKGRTARIARGLLSGLLSVAQQQ